MVDLGLGEYITQVPSTRYPVYTRGNAGEVWPEVAYPLTITLTRKAGEIASAQAAINAGVITLKDIKDGHKLQDIKDQVNYKSPPLLKVEGLTTRFEIKQGFE